MGERPPAVLFTLYTKKSKGNPYLNILFVADARMKKKKI